MALKSNRRKLLTSFSLFLILFLSTGCSNNQKGELTEQYNFDSEGKVVSKIAPDGSKTLYKYDQDFLTEVIYPDKTC